MTDTVGLRSFLAPSLQDARAGKVPDKNFSQPLKADNELLKRI